MIGAEALHKSGDVRQWIAGRVAPWRADWDHALARYYRARGRRGLPPRLAAAGILAVWGILLIGTGLGVSLYPQATDVRCDWFTCYYPVAYTGHPFYRFAAVVGEVLGFCLCSLPPLLLVAAVLTTFVRGLRGRLRRGPHGPQIATGWQNGMTALLSITPLGPDGLVRVRFLTRVDRLWRQRAWIAMILGVIASYFVSLHVLYPIFWWLGPWRQWAAQLALVLLWCAAVVVWMLALAALSTLQEVTYHPERMVLGLHWSSIPALAMFGMGLTPIGVAVLHFQSRGYLSYHDANTLSVTSAPIIMILVGGAYIGINYWLACRVFRLRLRHQALS